MVGLCDTPDYFSNKFCIDDAFKRARVNTRVVDQCMRDSGGLEKNQTTFLGIRTRISIKTWCCHHMSCSNKESCINSGGRCSDPLNLKLSYSVREGRRFGKCLATRKEIMLKRLLCRRPSIIRFCWHKETITGIK